MTHHSETPPAIRGFSRLQLLIFRNSGGVILDHSAERPRCHSVALLCPRFSLSPAENFRMRRHPGVDRERTAAWVTPRGNFPQRLPAHVAQIRALYAWPVIRKQSEAGTSPRWLAVGQIRHRGRPVAIDIPGAVVRVGVAEYAQPRDPRVRRLLHHGERSRHHPAATYEY